MRRKNDSIFQRIICMVLAIVLVASVCPIIQSDAASYAEALPLPTLTGDQAKDVVNIALSQLGYSESKKGGTVYGSWWTGVVKNGYDYTSSGWCAMFACWCANLAGAGMNVAYDSSSAQVQKLMEWLKKNGKVETDFSSKPKAGDFIFFGYGSSASHVAIVVDYDEDTNVVTFVGGNQSNKVKKTTTIWSKKGLYGKQKVIGYGRPNYGRVKPTAAPNVKTDKSSYYMGSEVSISWSAVSGSTSYSITILKGNKVVLEKNLGKKTSYTFKNISEGKYTVKVTSNNGYVPSKAGTCKFTVANIDPSVRYWLTEPADGYLSGEIYELGYEVFDKISGELLSGSRYEYKVNLKIKDGEGKTVHSEKYTDNGSQMSFFFPKAGTYKVEVKVSGAFKLSESMTVEVGENPKMLHSATDSLNLSLQGAASSAGVYVWVSGEIDGKPLLLWQRDNTNVSCEWGEPLEDGRTPLIITAKAAGSTVITLAVKADGSDVILDMITLSVDVDPTGFSISYDANGGVGAPAPQVKPLGGVVTLQSGKPQREGYIFLGWSCSPDATTAEYQPGTVFMVDAHSTLYAVWSETFLSGDANVDGTVNIKDWNCLYEHGNQLSAITGGALYSADVNGDGEVNLKDWARLYEHVCEVNPLW